MAFSENWVETDPDGSVITVSNLDDWVRKTKIATRERMEGDTALPLTGLIEAGSWTTAPMPRKGAARIHVIANQAAIAALDNQDGRLAITTDENRLWHLAAAGDVELGYLPKVGGTVTGATTFNVGVNIGGGLSITAGGLTVTGAASFQTVTGGTYNGQTISSAASFTGTLAVPDGISTFGKATANNPVIVQAANTNYLLTFRNAAGSHRSGFYANSGGTALHLDGPLVFDSTVTMAGAVTLSNTLAVTGLATASKGMSWGGAVAPAYGPTVNIDASLSQRFNVRPSDGVAFTIANPTNGVTGQIITISVVNISGGALGALTWGAAYKADNTTQPAADKLRIRQFQYDGSNWHQISGTSFDLAQ